MAAFASSELDSWKAPTSEAWAPFAEAVAFTVSDWDVLKMAMDGGWGEGNPLNLREKLLDDLLANFAERWIKGKEVEPDSVNTFLLESMDDLFCAELEDSMAWPLSKVVCTLYKECTQGEMKGVNFILEKFGKSSKNKNSGEKEENQNVETQVEKTASDLANMTVDAPSAKKETTVDDDGWEVVTKKKGGRRNR